MGLGSGVFGLILIGYGVWFYKVKAPKIIV
jgi:hypothetical protein